MKEMKPGRELDALVAEKVMGLLVNRSSGQVMPPVLRGPGVFRAQELKPYSTDIAAAWEVVEKIKERFPLVEIIDRRNDERYWIKVWNDSYEIIATVFAKTAPLAICLAALKAVNAS